MNENIFWAVVRNQTDRHSYIEVAHIEGNKWQVVLGYDEYTIRTTKTDFFEILQLALQKRTPLPA